MSYSQQINRWRTNHQANGRAEKGYDYASTQLNMPVKVMAKALTFAATIDEDDLVADGVDTESHVTIKYGLRDDAILVIPAIAANYAPLKLTFGAVTLFERDEFDVIKVDVESDELRRLHNEIMDSLPNHESWPQYNPHLTIAYVKPGTGQKYVGDGPLLGESVVVDTLWFCASDGSKVGISLRADQPVGPIVDKGLRANNSPPTYFTAYKGSDGRYRWTMISSNSYQDRDGEWATQKAQVADVERMNRTGQFGTLDWWHTKLKAADGRFIPLDIGDCTHAVMLGRFRLEGGTFRDEAVGASFTATKERLGASLEFLHPANEPAGGQYHHMFTIRRSVLPADAASNSLTGLVIGQKEQIDMSKSTYERLKAMAAQNGVDAVLQAIAGVAELDEQAKGLKLAAKSAGGGVITDPLASLSDADLDALAADIVALKEQREKAQAEGNTTVLEANLDLDVAALTEAMTKAFRSVVTEQTDTLTALLTDRTKEQVEADRKAADLEAKIKQMNAELAELKAGPKATKEQQANGYRPTRHNPATATTPTTPEQGMDGFEMIAQKAVNL